MGNRIEEHIGKAKVEKDVKKQKKAEMALRNGAEQVH